MVTRRGLSLLACLVLAVELAAACSPSISPARVRVAPPPGLPAMATPAGPAAARPGPGLTPAAVQAAAGAAAPPSSLTATTSATLPSESPTGIGSAAVPAAPLTLPTATPSPLPLPIGTLLPLLPAATQTVSPAPAAATSTSRPAATPTTQPTAAPAALVPPVVQILAPPPGAQVSAGQTVGVTSLSADDAGLDRVELRVNNVLVDAVRGTAGQKTLEVTQPWQAAAPGTAVLTVVAYDVYGNASAPALLTITVPGSPDTPSPTLMPTPATPVVTLLSPSGPLSVAPGQEITVQSTAVDPSGISRIELWVDNQMVTYTQNPAPTGAEPFDTSQVWQSSVTGSHDLFVRAFDTTGQSGDSAHVAVTVQATTGPAATVSVDPTTLTAGGKVKVYTTATDPMGIARIELWVGGALVDTVTSSDPAGQQQMSASQSWRAKESGHYDVFVRVYDAAGQSTDSSTVRVRVVDEPDHTATPAGGKVSPTAATPAPAGTPGLGAPMVAIEAPGPGFDQPMDETLPVAVSASGSAALSRIELWGYYQGQQTPQLLVPAWVGNQTSATQTFRWRPTAAGPVFLFARVVDATGQVGTSATVAGTISAR